MSHKIFLSAVASGVIALTVVVSTFSKTFLLFAAAFLSLLSQHTTRWDTFFTLNAIFRNTYRQFLNRLLLLLCLIFLSNFTPNCFNLRLLYFIMQFKFTRPLNFLPTSIKESRSSKITQKYLKNTLTHVRSVRWFSRFSCLLILFLTFLCPSTKPLKQHFSCICDSKKTKMKAPRLLHVCSGSWK